MSDFAFLELAETADGEVILRRSGDAVDAEPLVSVRFSPEARLMLGARTTDIARAMVGAGAEAIADGSIHIYGPLRGRALAGASGNTQARIFCREFNAELVAIAGTYKVLDEIPKKLLGKAVQIWLDKDQLRIEELA